MKQLQNNVEELESYKDIVAAYRTALDLLSEKGFAQLDRLIESALSYAELISDLKSEKKNLLDVGSGVGLPGIPLALFLPNYEVMLVERRQKRAAFLKIVVSQLGLDNATVINEDVTSFRGIKTNIVTAMAVAPLKDLYCWTKHLHEPKLTLVSRKGTGWKGEVSDLEACLALPEKLEVIERPLPYRGTLVGVQLPGGLDCLS